MNTPGRYSLTDGGRRFCYGLKKRNTHSTTKRFLGIWQIPSREKALCHHGALGISAASFAENAKSEDRSNGRSSMSNVHVAIRVQRFATPVQNAVRRSRLTPLWQRKA